MSAISPVPAAPHFLSDSLVFDWRAQSFRPDLIFVLPLALCLTLGVLLGHPGAGLIACGGAFTVGFGAKQNIDDSRFLPMILATLGTGAATFIGMVAGHTNFILVLIAAGAGFVYGMLSLRQAGTAWVGQQFMVFLLVASGFPFSSRAAAIRSSLVMAGGALQIVTSSILLRLLDQLRNDLKSVAHYLRLEHQAVRSSVEQAARSLFNRDTAPSAVPYAVRLAVTLGISTEIYRHFGFANGYWIPMTALLVLRPGLTDTVSRAIARTLGTVTGALVASFSLAHLSPAPPTLAFLTILFAWLSYSLNSVNYGLFTVCLTAYLVCLLALNSLPGKEVAYHRAVSTIIGGTLALTVRLIVIRYRRRKEEEAIKARAFG
ncbi:MAG: FUSC family protein [Acidobacteriaceae bacterium]